MKAVFHTFLLVAILCSTAFCAETKIDSLEHLLTNTEAVERVDILLQLSKLIGRSDPLKAENYAAEALIKAENHDYTEGIVKALIYESTIIAWRGDFNSAREKAHRALGIAEEASLTRDCASAQLVLGNLYVRREAFVQALDYYIAGLVNADLVGDKMLSFNLLMNIGVIKEELNELEEAEDYLNKALKRLEEENNLNRSGGININLGLVQKKRGNYGLAIEYFEKALNTFEANGNTYHVGLTLSNIGSAWEAMGQYQKAIDTYNKSIAIRNEVKDMAGLAKVTFAKARTLYAQKNKGKVLKLGTEALSLSDELQLYALSRDINKFLAEVNADLGQFETAYYYHQAYVTAKDTATAKQSEKRINNMLDKYEFEQLNLRAEQQEQELLVRNLKIDQRNTLLFGLGVILVLLSALFYSHRSRMRNNLKRVNETREIAENRAEALSKELMEEKDKLMKFTKGFLESPVSKEEIENTVPLEEGTDFQRSADTGSLLRSSIMNDKDWGAFNALYESAYPGLFYKIDSEMADMTLYEKRLLMLVKLHLTNQEMGIILGISKESVAQAKYRLRKKLNLDNSREMKNLVASL